jgi:prepilin-type N-terminal cleavage/methylation domain-containing protein
MKATLSRTWHGFTLIEVMIVVSIIGMLVVVLSINALQSSQQSRDAKRQADLKTLQAAIELYRNKHGRYPAQATSTNPLAGGWSGQLGTNYAPDNGTGQYIVGLAPDFISVLPADKHLNGADSGYVYRTNSAGTVYKIMAMKTVESERLDSVSAYLHPFKSCDRRGRLNADSSVSYLSAESWCHTTTLDIGYGAGGLVLHCAYDHVRFQTSYGVWGGIAPLFPTTLTSTDGLTANQRNSAVRNTASVICQ